MKPVSKLKHIIEGFYYSTVEDPVREEIAKDRAKICSRCPHAVAGRLFMAKKNDKIKEIEGLKCNVCECGLSEKLRVKDETCPKNKWE